MSAEYVREKLWNDYKTKARCSDDALLWLANYHINTVKAGWEALAKYLNTNVN